MIENDEAAWPVGLVGEQHHAFSISTCAVGDRVLFVREIGNPFDGEAVAAVTEASRRIGYVARDHWLREAIVDERRHFGGKILSLEPGRRGFVQVVILAAPVAVETLRLPHAQLEQLVTAPVPVSRPPTPVPAEPASSATDAPQAAQPRGGFSRLFGAD